MEIKTIPFSNGFFASTDGKIFDSEINERTQYENGDSYKTASICLTNGKWVTFGVHRLVALAHIPIDNPQELTVNHRDLDKQNNNASNLEWLSAEQNNLHAALFRSNPKKPVAYTVSDTGVCEFVFKITDLSLKLQSNNLDIWDAVKNNSKLKGYQIFPFTNKTPIPDVLKVNRKNVPVVQRPVKVLDVESEAVFYFKTLHEAARVFNTSASHISVTISTASALKLFQRKYIIVEEDDQFPEYDKEDIDSLLGSTGFSVIAFKTTSQTYEIYESASSFIRINNLSKKAVTTRLKNGKIEEVNGYYFTYFNEKNRSRLFQIMGRPGPHL